MNSAGENSGQATTGSIRARFLVALVLFAPLLLHLLGLLLCLRNQHGFDFGRLDFVILILVLGYAILAGLAFNHRAFALRFVTLAYAALLTVAIAELVLFFQDPLRHRRLVRAPMRSVTVAADTMPGTTGKISFSVNNLGVRGPALPLEKSELKILCVGGSTVECLHVTDEASWPWLLGTRLSRLLGKTVLVGNAGKSGHIVLHHEYLLRHYEYADRFDRVVVMCGMNDMGALLRHNYGQRAAAVEEETLGSPPAKGPYYRRMACLPFANRSSGRASIEQDAGGAMYADWRARRREMLARNTYTILPSGLPEALAQYKLDLERLIRLCQGRKQELLFLTHPSIYRTNLPPDLTALIWEHTDEGPTPPAVLEAVLAEYNAALLATAKEHGVECLDLAALVPKDTTAFYDDCHLNLQGCETVAKILSNYFMSRLAQPGGKAPP